MKRFGKLLYGYKPQGESLKQQREEKEIIQEPN